jgi:hypothetical protein
LAAFAPRADAACPAASRVTLLIIGQSLGSWWPITPADVAFIDRLRQTGETRPISILNTAVGGSSLLYATRPASAPDHYWWDERTRSPGPLLVKALDRIKRATDRPNVIAVMNGQQDSWSWRPAAGYDLMPSFYTAMVGVIGRLRSACAPQTPTSVPVIVERLGTRSTGWESYPGMAPVREAQDRLVARSGFNAHWGARPTADEVLRDVVHPTDTGFAWRGVETADATRGRV